MRKMALSLTCFLALSALNANEDVQKTDVSLDKMTVSSQSLGYSDIDSTKFANSQAGLLSESLRDMPGVYVGGTNGFNQKLYMRGVNDRAINLTIDGAKQKGNSFHHNADLLIDPELLKSANVNAGVNSVSQGAGALGGSIAFKTVDASDLLAPNKSIGAKLKAGYASNNKDFSKSLTVYGRAFDSLDLLGYISHHAHDFGKSGDGYRVGGDGYDLSSLLKAKYHISDNQFVGLSFNQMKYDGKYAYKPEFGFVPTKNKKTGITAPQDLQNQSYTRNTFTLDYALKANDFLNLEANAYTTDNVLDRKGDKGWSVGIRTSGVNINNKTFLNPSWAQNTLFYGIEYYQTQNRVERWAGKEFAAGDKAGSVTAFIEDKISINNLSLTPGVKLDAASLETMAGGAQDKRFSKNFSGVSGSFTTEYGFDFGLGLFAGYTQVFRAPDVIEAIRLTGFQTYSNSKDLKPETGANTELGLNYKAQFGESVAFNAVAKYFFTNYDNLIAEFAKPGSTANAMRSNAGNAKINGVELLAGVYVGDFSVLGSFSKASTEYKSLNNIKSKSGASYYGDIVGRDAGDKYTLNLEYLVASIDLSLGANAIYVSELKTDTETKPSYNVFDIYASYAPQSLEGLQINLGVYNVADSAYVSHTSRSATGGNRDLEPGRSIKGTISYKF